MQTRPIPALAPRPPLRYGQMDSPLGKLHVAVSPRGVCRISFSSRTEKTFLKDLSGRFPGPMKPGGYPVESVLKQLRQYFEGGKRGFHCRVDLTGRSEFERKVLEFTREIPLGTLVTYQDLARRIGRPRACRAVGNALGRNPVPILIPCHRVVASNGGLGGFTGRIQLKRFLLEHEGLEPYGNGTRG